MERKLASIQRIRNIEPIPGADAIEKATVLGWQLVVKKNEFVTGELCVYVEIDSVLPDYAAFEFLRPRNFRIRTVKLRGQISQGICFPLSLLPEGIVAEEGLDVAEALKITKYEPPVPASLSGLMKGLFPSFIPKTDETRVQVLQELLDKYHGKTCYITEKLDGTSITCYIKDGVFGVCSRNMELAEGNTLYWKIVREMDIENKLRKLGRNVAIQGELMGNGIQGNKLKLTGSTIFFFSLFWIDEYKYADYNEWKTVMLTQLALPTVPVITDAYNLSNNIDSLLKMAEIPSCLNSAVMAEGIVTRVVDENEHISFKAISNAFLLKYDDE
jgi:RNA ligase (TIGR02306 family)